MNAPKELFATLAGADGAPVPLLAVAVEARLLDLAAIVDVTQTYRNDGRSAIEAVYTFPLPMGAVLLDLTLALDGRKLAGTVVPRKEAERRYEDAIDAGHGALLLQRTDEGLYTLNLGNLLPGQEAEVRYRYGLFLRWNGDEVRFALPSTVAPRYGDPARAGLQPHQAPVVSLAAHYPLDLKVVVHGQLAGGRVSSPTHAIQAAIEDGGLALTLARPAALDRDFVLNFRVAGKGATTAWYAPDGEAWALWASVRPDLPESTVPGQRSLRLLVDCSGSMAGDSMEQAKAALAEIVGRLRADETFNLVAFGNGQKALFSGDQLATADKVDAARRWIATLQADMGGTELAKAVEYTLSQPTRAPLRNLLLITDGEVWDSPRLFHLASQHRTRIFPVGVGSAPAQDVLRKLARESGGAAEFVTPDEEMAPRIVRHFERLRQIATRTVETVWPGQAFWRVDTEAGRIFSGDTLHLCAGLRSEPKGDFALICRLEDSRMVSFMAAWAPAPEALKADLPRLIAARRLAEMRDVEAARALAVSYRLVSEYTHYLVVAERAEGERAEGLPDLAVVPQMLAAGWGGTGSVKCHAGGPQIPERFKDANFDMPSMSHRSPMSPSEFRQSSRRAPARFAAAEQSLRYDMARAVASRPMDPLRGFVQALELELAGRSRKKRDAAWLEWLGAPEGWVAVVHALAASQGEQVELVKALMAYVLPQLIEAGLGQEAVDSIQRMQVRDWAATLVQKQGDPFQWTESL